MATRYQFVDDSGETRLAGFLVPEPGGSGSVLTATVEVTSAELKALTTIPVQLVAAPGAGKIIQTVLMSMQFVYGTIDYTGDNNDIEMVCGLNAYGGNNEVVSFDPAFFLGAASYLVARGVPTFQYTAGAAKAANAPIWLANFGDELADGDSTLTVTLAYVVVDVAA